MTNCDELIDLRGRRHRYAIFSDDAHAGTLLLAADQTLLMLSVIC